MTGLARLTLPSTERDKCLAEVIYLILMSNVCGINCCLEVPFAHVYPRRSLENYFG